MIGDNGDQLGIVKVNDALEKAAEVGLDLVVVADKDQANIPVCKILDFSKRCYAQKCKKKSQRKNQSVQKLKEIRFHVNTDTHDYNYKIIHAKEFLEKRNKVKINLMFRGREFAHKIIGFELVDKIIEDLKEIGLPEGKSILAGKSITITLNPIK